VIRGRHDWSPLAPTPSFRARDQIFYSESRVGFGGKAHGPGDQQPALPRPPSRPSTVFVSCKREAGKEETAGGRVSHAWILNSTPPSWRCISRPLSFVVAAFPFFSCVVVYHSGVLGWHADDASCHWCCLRIMCTPW
jgi:hypothetical protein